MRKIPHSGPRMETGAVQFGDDWPGVFIRGDEALARAFYLRAALETNSVMYRPAALRLAALLEGCRASGIEAATAGEMRSGSIRKDESPAREAGTPKGDRPCPTK